MRVGRWWGVCIVWAGERETCERLLHIKCVINKCPGELLEFFKANGEVAAKPGEVAKILKSDVEGEEEDSIKLVDGRTLEFMGIGPPEPVIVIRVRTAMNVAAAAAEVGVEEDTDAADAIIRQEAISALLRSALPAAAVTRCRRG